MTELDTRLSDAATKWNLMSNVDWTLLADGNRAYGECANTRSMGRVIRGMGTLAALILEEDLPVPKLKEIFSLSEKLTRMAWSLLERMVC